MLRVLAISAVAGCGFSAGTGSMNTPVDAPLGTEPGMPDAPGDVGMVDAPMMALSCHGSFKMVCIGIVPAPTLDVGGSALLAINTDTSSQCLAPAAGSTVTSGCILAAANIYINGTIRATGSKPLILIATTQISVNGGALIDVASRVAEQGAGGRTSCSGGGPGGNAGGSGGSFGTRGGIGGSSGGSTSGTPGGVTALQNLVGGCPGVAGGGLVANHGAAGLGGGAVLVISPSINMNGKINASGGGGGGGVLVDGGGGGGGSGGVIVFDTANLTFNGGSHLFAQGGGGGEGASLTTAGAAGATASAVNTAALGGRNTNNDGGDGGDGAVSSDASSGGSGDDSGGGGGGGAGHIYTTDTTFNNNGQSAPAIVQ